MATTHSIYPAHETFSAKHVQRFWGRALKLPSGCWEWQGALDPDGYGTFNVNQRRGRAHRLAWELANQAAIPAGLTIDHLCRNRRCVNPGHLEPVTMGENTSRGFGPTAIHARKTHCKHGHPFAGDNLVIERGFRLCRTCEKQRRASRYKRTGK